MITRNFVEQDLELQRYAATPQEKKPRFEWRDVTDNLDGDAANRLQVRVGGQTRDFDIAEIAETVGNALTDLALSRNEENIFSDKNRELVAGIAQSVARDLYQRLEGTEGEHTASAEEMMEIIERALIRHNAHDVAKSLVIRRKSKPARQEESAGDIDIEGGGANANRGKVKTKVIRRNGEVVAWNQNKIEIAVRSAFLSLHMDSSAATEVANDLTAQIQKSGQEYIHIEDLQDRVQETLMKLGHYKVAEAFILYRAHRSAQRLQEAHEAGRSSLLTTSRIR